MPRRAQHGEARTSDWALKDVSAGDTESAGLETGHASMQVHLRGWPHLNRSAGSTSIHFGPRSRRKNWEDFAFFHWN